MKTSLLSLAGFLPAALVAPLHALSPGAFVNGSPGSATWTEEITPTGTRTIFSIGANSIFQWNDGFNLAAGSELVFDFTGGKSVVNVLGGTGVNFIGGNVTSNGNVSFVSPQADLLVGGSITAKSVTLTTLNVDPAALLAEGGNLTFSGDPASATGLSISGSIRATGGDILLSGQRIVVGDTAKLRAKGAVMIAGGSVVQLDRNSATRKLKATSGDGFVYHLGDTKAGRIEVAAGAEFVHKGRLDASRIFLEVGQNGKILKESGGILVGKVTLNGGVIQKGVDAGPHEGDATSSLSPSTLKMPAIKRPDGSTVSASRTVVSNVPVSASADTARDRRAASGSVASRDKSAKQPMLQRASFFGMRGGSEVVKADKR